MKTSSAVKFILLAGLIFSSQTFAQSFQKDYSSSSASSVKSRTPSAKNSANDEKITSTIVNSINQDPALSKLNLQVNTNRGLVTLIGNVNSDTQLNTLVSLAESVEGVSDVDASRVTIENSQHPVSDAMTTAKIKGLLIREKLFGEKDIAAITTSVETTNGNVYLSGRVDNQDQIQNAIEIIKKNVPEVKHIEYHIIK